MKIACQSCQAKYTIADEKVVGKVVKIRCKKCGTTIVVNGQEGGGGGDREEATEVRSSSADLGLAGGAATTQSAEAEGWTVNVADDDQRTMSTAQIATGFASGVVTDETYCWRDGMGDWLPLREIDELAAACGIGAATQPAAPPQAAVRGGSVRPQAAAGGGLGGLFGSASSGAAAQASAASGAAAARRGGRAGGADLFGAAAEAGGENDVMTSAPNSGARGDDGKMTGQRNENSVLFSLNALTANEPKKAPGGKPLGAAEGDGSGLIDIRALSSAMASSGPKKGGGTHADDIMNLGGGGAFSAALAAPVLTAPPLDSGDTSPQGAASNKKMMMMFGGLASLLIFGMLGMYFMLKPAPVVATTAGEGPATGASAAGGTGPAPATSAAATAPTTAPDPGPSAVAANDTKATSPNVGGGATRPRQGGNAPVAVANNTPAPVAPPSPGVPKSLEDQMKSSVPNANVPSAPPPSAGSTAPFDRGAAAGVLGGIADSVGSCKKSGGPTGDGHVSITFSPSGSVVSAIVDQPPFAGTAVGGCVAGKFRGAHVPAFAGGNLTIGKRFSIN